MINLKDSIDKFEVTHEYDFEPFFTQGKEPVMIVELKITLVDGSYLRMRSQDYEFHDAKKQNK